MSTSPSYYNRDVDQLNKFTLIFKSSDIEVLYQSQSIQRLLKPLYYGLVFMSLVLNTLRVIVKYKDLDSIPYVNIMVFVISVISLFVVHKYDKTTSMIMTFENACIILYQLNFSDGTTGQEYFMYGNNFALIQAVFYFATDFYLSFPSVILHFTFRCVITTLLSKRFDMVGFLISVGTATFLISVLYICNKAQRLQFLMNLKENTIESQLKTLINKPLAKFRYNEKKLLFEVDQQTFERQFANYEEDLCQGCNFRNFMRECKIDDISIETLLTQNRLPFQQVIEVAMKKQRLKIRLNPFNIDNSIILIIDQFVDESKTFKKIPQQLFQQLKNQFKVSKLHSQQFKYGIMSILYIGQFQIKKINIVKFLNRIISHYPFNQKQFKMNHGNKCNKRISTYPHQLQIFFIQIFNIIMILQQEQCNLDDISIHCYELCLAVKFSLSKPKRFLEMYTNNYFIKQTQQHLLFAPVRDQLVFYFNRIIPFNNLNFDF